MMNLKDAWKALDKRAMENLKDPRRYSELDKLSMFGLGWGLGALNRMNNKKANAAIGVVMVAMMDARLKLRKSRSLQKKK